MATKIFPTTVYIFLLIELLAVSYVDVIKRKIGNIWSLINVIVFFVLIFLIPDQYSFNAKSFSYSIVFLMVGFLLFLLKIMGGGDSKYLSTMFLLIPVSFQDIAMLSLIYTTIFIGAGIILINTVKNYKSIFESIKNRNLARIKLLYGKKLAFAPVVLLSWFIFGWINKERIF